MDVAITITRLEGVNVSMTYLRMEFIQDLNASYFFQVQSQSWHSCLNLKSKHKFIHLMKYRA